MSKSFEELYSEYNAGGDDGGIDGGDTGQQQTATRGQSRAADPVSEARAAMVEDVQAAHPGLADFDASVVEAVALGLVVKDPSIQAAFEKGGAMWSRAVRKMAPEIAKTLGAEMPRSRDPRQLQGARAAARATENRRGANRDGLSEEDQAVLKMSNGQFIEHLRRKGISLGI